MTTFPVERTYARTLSCPIREVRDWRQEPNPDPERIARFPEGLARVLVVRPHDELWRRTHAERDAVAVCGVPEGGGVIVSVSQRFERAANWFEKYVLFPFMTLLAMAMVLGSIAFAVWLAYDWLNPSFPKVTLSTEYWKCGEWRGVYIPRGAKTGGYWTRDCDKWERR